MDLTLEDDVRCMVRCAGWVWCGVNAACLCVARLWDELAQIGRAVGGAPWRRRASGDLPCSRAAVRALPSACHRCSPIQPSLLPHACRCAGARRMPRTCSCATAATAAAMWPAASCSAWRAAPAGTAPAAAARASTRVAASTGWAQQRRQQWRSMWTVRTAMMMLSGSSQLRQALGCGVAWAVQQRRVPQELPGACLPPWPPATCAALPACCTAGPAACCHPHHCRHEHG